MTLARQVIRFNLVGVLNTAVDVALFYVLVRWVRLPSAPAQVLSYTLGAVNSYLWNKFWTFGAGSTLAFAEVTRFGLVNLASLLLSVCTLQLVARWQPIWVAKVAATAVGVLVNFGGNRFWVFAVTSPGSGGRAGRR